MQGDNGAGRAGVQRPRHLGRRPLPVGRAGDAEVVRRNPVGVQRHHRQRRLLLRGDGVVELDPVVRQVLAYPLAEQVVGDAREQAGGHAEAGEPERDVGGAAAGRDLEVAADGRRHEVDESLAGHGDHAGALLPFGPGWSGAVIADPPGARCR